MKRIHIIGHKNSGKTTLIADLVTELTRRGHRVGTIKHTHHDHELDTPGKDSHRHREAGSVAVGILTRHMNAIFWPSVDQENCSNSDQGKYEQFDAMMNDCDLVLVEGDSRAAATRIEVFRSASDRQPFACSDATIEAVVTDDDLELATQIWKRSDLSLIAGNIERILRLVATRN